MREMVAVWHCVALRLPARNNREPRTCGAIRSNAIRSAAASARKLKSRRLPGRSPLAVHMERRSAADWLGWMSLAAAAAAAAASERAAGRTKSRLISEPDKADRHTQLKVLPPSRAPAVDWPPAGQSLARCRLTSGGHRIGRPKCRLQKPPLGQAVAERADGRTDTNQSL